MYTIEQLVSITGNEYPVMSNSNMVLLTYRNINAPKIHEEQIYENYDAIKPNIEMLLRASVIPEKSEESVPIRSIKIIVMDDFQNIYVPTTQNTLAINIGRNIKNFHTSENTIQPLYATDFGTRYSANTPYPNNCIIWNLKRYSAKKTVELLLSVLENTLLFREHGNTALSKMYAAYMKGNETELNELVENYKKEKNTNNCVEEYLNNNSNSRTNLLEEINNTAANLEHIWNKYKETLEKKNKLEMELYYINNKEKETTNYNDAKEMLINALPECVISEKEYSEYPMLYVKGYTFLKNWDKDMLDTCYDRSDTYAPKIFIRKIFDKEEILLKVYVDINVNLITGNVHAKIPIPENIYQNGAIPHPHLSTYNCWGNHAAQIKTNIIGRDYIGAFVQLIYAIQQLNMYDACVMERLGGMLSEANYYDYTACYSAANPEEAIKLDALDLPIKCWNEEGYSNDYEENYEEDED